jgi:alpha-tubulin suppressor-like RCC1 family protein
MNLRSGSFLSYFLVLQSEIMKMRSPSWRMVLRKLLIAGTGVCAASTAVVIAGAPAQGSPAGEVEHWGFYGAVDELRPAALSLPAPVAQVGSSNSTLYALLTNGTVYAMGIGTNGQLGNDSTLNSFNTPVQVRFPAGVTIASIPTDVMPMNAGFAVDTRGHVWAWGEDAGGEFCLGNTKEYLTPVELPFSDVTTLAGAYNHATYDAGGTLYSCGDNQYGVLGDGSTQSSKTPVRVIALAGQEVTSLVASWNDTGAVLADGTYFDWGYNADGQLGDGTIGTPSAVPVRVPLADPVTQAAEGGSLPGNGQTLVLLSDGSVYAWGDDTYYQLGDGKTASEGRPVKILPPAGVTYRTLATGGNTSYAVSTNGNVYAWGVSAAGEIGNGATATAKRPVKVASGATTISSTAADVVVSLAAGRPAG